MRAWLPLLMIPVLLGGFGCDGEDPGPFGPEAVPALTPTPPDLTPWTKLAADLALIARGQAPTHAETLKNAAKLADGRMTVTQYIDALLDSSRVGASTAHKILFQGSQGTKSAHPVPQSGVLRSFETDAGPVFYLRQRCEPADAELVSPWWEVTTQVRVCPDSHRPAVFGDAEGRGCFGKSLTPKTDVCGCGPRLMWCAPDGPTWKSLKAQVQAEVTDTVAYVVNEDLPLESLFTMNETVRGRGAELIYRRARVVAGEDPSIIDREGIANAPALRPRLEQTPGQHAGILTTPSLVFGSDALRGVMRNYFDYLWCVGISSSGVTTEEVLALEVVDLRVGDGWKQLAGMPICTDCHARLDYGMQFFAGWPSGVRGTDFQLAEALSGQGPLYGRSIDDPRGEDDLSPAGFARLVTRQPEFGQCMVQKVVDHVFGGTSAASDVAAVTSVFEETHRLKAMLREAMVRFAEQALAVPTPLSASPLPDDGAAALRDQVDASCRGCHGPNGNPNYSEDPLPANAIEAMLDQVAFEGMPRTPTGFDEGQRRAFIDAAVVARWAAPENQQAARDHFTGRMHAHPTHLFGAIMGQVGEASGVAYAPGYNAIEYGIPPDRLRYSPGIAAQMGLAALRTCRSKNLERSAFERCVAAASDPTLAIRGSVNGGPTANQAASP